MIPRMADRTLVLLHAFPLSSAMWDPQLDAFDGWRVMAPDVGGFRRPNEPAGKSGGGPPGAGMNEWAAEIARLLDARGVAQAVIGGLSMGGYLAFALYRHAPDRFGALVLADTRATADSEEAKAGRRAMQGLADGGGARAIADDMLPKLLGETTRRDQPEIGARVRALIEANRPASIKAALDAMMNRQDARPLLPRIACPTLIVVGEEDTLTPAAASEEMHRAIRGSRLVTIPRAGHLSNLEQPGAFNGALGRFLKDL